MITSDRIARLNAIEQNLSETDFPPQIVIESTAICNFQCIHCHHKDLVRPKGHMDLSLYRRLIDEIAENAPATEVWPTFYGEAMVLGYRVYAMLNYARMKGLTNVVLNSNGSLLSDEHIEFILDSGLQRFILSLDGFTKETFEKIRYTQYAKGKHDVVYPNVAKLLKRKAELDATGASTPKIVCQFSVMDENQDEVESFTEYWLNLGADVKTREKMTWTGLVDAENLESDLSVRIACPWGHNTCAIQWNGDVVACAVDNEGRFVAGNVNEHPIAEIWNGPLKEFRAAHREHRFEDLPSVCRECVDWQAVGAKSMTPAKDEYASVAAGKSHR